MSFWWEKGKNLQRRAEWLASQTFVVLSIQVPKENDKTPQSSEQFFAALHGIFRSDPITQEHVSFEIVAKKDSIVFYVFTPIHLREFVEGQLYAQYPDLDIIQVTDYTKHVSLEGLHVATTCIELTKDDVYPIKTFLASEVDPLAGITAVLSGLNGREQMWLQMVTRPIGDEWQNLGVKYVQDVRAGRSVKGYNNKPTGAFRRFLGHIIREIISPGSSANSAGIMEPPKLSSPQEAALKGIETKITKLGFETIFRLVAISDDSLSAKFRLQALLAAFKQYNTTNLNGFKGGDIKVDDYESWEKFITREFEEKGNILNIEELASVYHFPATTVETAAISWAGSKKSEAPFNLPLKDIVPPEDLTILGKTDFRNISKEFGIKNDDRKRHIYVIGKSGVGKSTLLENMIIDDINDDRGVIVVDPHGELADKIVESIPERRIKDTVLLNPADREFPISFNLLEQVGDDYKGMVASGFVGIFKKIFGNSWGPRLEYILRNTVLALLDSKDATMLGIPRMLTEQAFRDDVIKQIKDTVIKDFWVNEWGGMDQRQRAEAIAPILNKVGQFLSTSTIRNIVGQPRSTIDIRRIMDEKKIFIINLSKGKIGEDNMALLGAMIITKVQLAAMSRSDVRPEDRPDSFLYVDEFQNFATESFASILSEARKYNLGLTIAHQYIAQLSEEVRDAVIGNVGTIISFRLGGPDAVFLEKEFAPIFNTNDLLNLQKGHIYIKLLVDGISSPAFSAQTMLTKQIPYNYSAEVIEYSRTHYSKTRADVEDIIDETAGFKRKKEAEAAVAKAHEILAQHAVVRPEIKQEVKAEIELHPTDQLLTNCEPVEMIEEEGSENELITPQNYAKHLNIANPNATLNQSKEVPAEEGIANRLDIKPLKVIDGYAYKEVSQKGGTKWYLGEKEEVVRQRNEIKQEKLAQKFPDKDSPTLPTFTEQTPILQTMPDPQILPAVQNITNDLVVEESKNEQLMALNEGDSISL
jgi:ABC-type oligopeptide transport system ATPase subunit